MKKVIIIPDLVFNIVQEHRFTESGVYTIMKELLDFGIAINTDHENTIDIGKDLVKLLLANNISLTTEDSKFTITIFMSFMEEITTKLLVENIYSFELVEIKKEKIIIEV